MAEISARFYLFICVWLCVVVEFAIDAAKNELIQADVFHVLNVMYYLFILSFLVFAEQRPWVLVLPMAERTTGTLLLSVFGTMTMFTTISSTRHRRRLPQEKAIRGHGRLNITCHLYKDTTGTH